MKASTLLRESIQYLHDGSNNRDSADKSFFVCFAILRARRDHGRSGGSTRATARVHKRIDQLLEGHSTILKWLYANKHITRRQFDVMYFDPSKKLQAYRRAWMEHLALEFEAKGD